MGVMGGFGIGVGITDHHQRAVAQRCLEPVQLRHAHQGIGGRHPPKIELTALHRLHLLTSSQTRLSRNRSRLKTPGPLNLSTVISVAHQPITGQQMGQAAGFAATHGVGLAGQGKRSSSGMADLASEQMQVDQAAHNCRALTALVDAHRPQTQNRWLAAPQPRHRPELLFSDAAGLSNAPRCPGLHRLGERCKALGGLINEVGIEANVFEDQPRQSVQQHQVCPWCNRQVMVGDLGGFGRPWIHHHNREALGIFLFALQQALEQHWMAFGCVGANQKGHRAVIEILVTARRTIGTKAAGVTSHRGTHAQARVRIEIVGTNGAFEELLRQVIVLGVELSGAIHRNRPRTFARQGAADASRQEIKGVVPADGLERILQRGSIQGLTQSSTREGLANRGPFDADLALA